MNTPNITQAMIDAYDEYTHLTLDRRGFMEKLTKLAGSGAAAATIAPLLAANPASAAITAEDDPKLKTEVEIRFFADGARTRVELEHRRLDLYGSRAAEMRGIFDSAGGWPGLLEALARALHAGASQ